MSLKGVFDGANGVNTEAVFSDDSIEFRDTQNIGNMVEEFRRDSENINKRAAGRIAARVPLVLHNQWVQEWREKYADKWELGTFLAMRVNSYDYSYLRNQKL